MSSIEREQTTICMFADCGIGVGMGHLVRSKALADVFEHFKIKVHWATKKALGGGPSPLETLFQKPVAPGNLLLDCDSDCGQAEAIQVGSWATTNKADWIIIDHYGVDIGYLTHLHNEMSRQDILHNRKPTRIAIMDDHQVRDCALVDARLSPMQSDSGEPKYHGLQLMGTQYLLIRPEFARTLASGSGPREGIVVCFGGADTCQLTGECINLIIQESSPLKKEPLTVLASDTIAAAQDLDRLIEMWDDKYGKPGIRITWADADTMAKLFLTSRYALVSCSGVAVEACAMQCPCVPIHWVDNQDRHAEVLTGLGYAVCRSPQEAVAALAIAKSMDASPIDPFGAWRVASAICGRDFMKEEGFLI
jgi:spore coat polysaccharide biosynthesis predicted glycosyltransferase SpsG